MRVLWPVSNPNSPYKYPENQHRHADGTPRVYVVDAHPNDREYMVSARLFDEPMTAHQFLSNGRWGEENSFIEHPVLFIVNEKPHEHVMEAIVKQRMFLEVMKEKEQ